MPHHQPRLASLLQWTAMVVSSFNSRAHSNVAHGVAKSGLQLPEVKALLTAVAEVALRSGLEGWAPQALSNLIWAYATARVRADALFAAVEREVASSPRGLDSYEAQNLSNLAWAYATAGVQADSLYAAIADAALRRKLRGFSPQNLSNIVWAYATAGRRTDSLFSSAAAAVTAHAAQGGLYEYQARTNPARPSPSPSSRRLLSPLALDLALPRLRCCSTSLLALAARAAPPPLAPLAPAAHPRPSPPPPPPPPPPPTRRKTSPTSHGRTQRWASGRMHSSPRWPTLRWAAICTASSPRISQTWCGRSRWPACSPQTCSTPSLPCCAVDCRGSSRRSSVTSSGPTRQRASRPTSCMPRWRRRRFGRGCKTSSPKRRPTWRGRSRRRACARRRCLLRWPRQCCAMGCRGSCRRRSSTSCGRTRRWVSRRTSSSWRSRGWR